MLIFLASQDPYQLVVMSSEDDTVLKLSEIYIMHYYPIRNSKCISDIILYISEDQKLYYVLMILKRICLKDIASLISKKVAEFYARFINAYIPKIVDLNVTIDYNSEPKGRIRDNRYVGHEEIAKQFVLTSDVRNNFCDLSMLYSVPVRNIVRHESNYKEVTLSYYSNFFLEEPVLQLYTGV